MRPKPVQIISILILLTIACPVFSEEFQRPTSVSVLTEVAENAEESSIAGVLDDAVRLHVELVGYRLADTETAEPDYLIRSVYTVSGSSIDVTITAETGRKAESVAQTAWTGVLDLDLDEKIGTVLNRDIFPAVPATIAENRRTTEKAAGEGEEWAVAALGITAVPETESEDEASEAKTGRWELDILGGIYVPTSEAATFSSFGYGGRLAFGYGFGRKVILSPRLVIGAVWLPTDTLTNTNLLLLPGGAELKIASPTVGFISPYIRLGGGVTWMMIFPDGSPPVGKIVPYGEVAIGMDFRISEVFQLVLDVSFSGQFEETVTLWGLSPTFGVGLRF